MEEAFVNTARAIYDKIQDGVIDVTNEVRVCTLHTHSICNSQRSHKQTYGIKVGYGAGASNTINPGSAAKKEGSGCC